MHCKLGSKATSPYNGLGDGRMNNNAAGAYMSAAGLRQCALVTEVHGAALQCYVESLQPRHACAWVLSACCLHSNSSSP